MRWNDIEVGEYYRFRASPNYAYAKPIKILKPREDENNNNNYILIKCEWLVNKNDQSGLIKYFKPKDLVRE